MQHTIQKKLYLLILLVVMFGLSACSFLEVDEGGVKIDGEPVDIVLFDEEGHAVMQQIFTRSNPIVKEYINKIDKLSEEVILIGSQSELLKFCPDSITPPNIDFQNNCLIVGVVVTPTTKSSVREIELYLQDNGEATFYTRIISSAIDGVKGVTFPYAVFSIPADKIKKLEIMSRVSFF